MVERKLLSVKIVHHRVRFHDDARLRTFLSGDERSGDRADQSIHQLMGILSKVPNITIAILDKPIEGVLG